LKDVSITAMQEKDLDSLAELEKICFSTPWTRGGLEAELSCPSAVFIVAHSAGGAAAGYAGMHCAAGECYVDNVAVLPQLRGNGIGEALMRRLILDARRRGGEFISLEVRKSNAPAISLYGKLGFVKAGERKGFYDKPREDALILTLWF